MHTNASSLRCDAHRTPVLGTRGMVATSQPLATAAGLRILDRGGNAADAALAAAAALNVTEPMSTGLGGDCFALFYEAAGGRVSALNGSGRAPAALTLERVRAHGFGSAIPAYDVHTITVPGACAGWCDLNARHGTLPLAEILAPAIDLAERGFPVAPVAAHQWRLGAERQLGHQPNGAELLIDGRAPQAGEIFRNPGLARTLRSVAEKGAEGFYRGEVARAIAEVVRALGGALDEGDLAEHGSTWDEPISTVYRGLRVWECPPNGQGLVALLALNLLRGFDVAGLEPLGPQRLHLLIECQRLAFADAHAWLCDPAHHGVPVEALLSEAYAVERRRLIDPLRARLDAKPGVLPGGADTVYLCAVDAAGNACSFINSNYMGFGTGIVPRGCGFTLQNRGMGFSLVDGHPNALAPRKRPYHTIIPGLLTRESDGSLYGPFGVMGGFMQPQGHAQVVVALADDGLDPQAALNRPRFNLREGDPAGCVAVEPELPEATRAALSARGHTLALSQGYERLEFGKGQIIRRDPSGVLWGGSEPRADGCAMSL